MTSTRTKAGRNSTGTPATDGPATTYIAFLRAINVGGRTVKMERLRALFEELGLGGVRSYIQSGNVFFTSTEQDRAALTRRIEDHLAAGLGYPVPVMLRTVEEIERLLAAEPFTGIEATPDVRLMLVFLSEPLPRGFELPQKSPKGDFEILGADQGTAYVVIHLQGGRMNINPGDVFGKTYGGQGTARFLHTTAKILAAAKKG
ncbi:DUF1697 domain-containing protein [Kitasatospora sp. NPDC050543]|uniref:DUF1697 domain-containing protein n=1 Tax=Kitasatospora sp. NPDC050543 TaxID=3364054 RepID=UPI0037A58706